jgi:hypothetical protein
MQLQSKLTQIVLKLIILYVKANTEHLTSTPNFNETNLGVDAKLSVGKNFGVKYY